MGAPTSFSCCPASLSPSPFPRIGCATKWRKDGAVRWAAPPFSVSQGLRLPGYGLSMLKKRDFHVVGSALVWTFSLTAQALVGVDGSMVTAE